MISVDVLNGKRCDTPGSDGFYYRVITSFIDGSGEFWCALMSDAGGTQITPYVSLRFERLDE